MQGKNAYLEIAQYQQNSFIKKKNKIKEGDQIFKALQATGKHISLLYRKLNR